MKLSFFGATRTTTGSQYLLEVNGRRFLLDCGLYQGKRAESIERNRTFPFDPQQLDAVILSHAHIDHCGNLPNLCRQGFTGNIYCTFATRDLASIMLEDSAEIQRADAEFVSKKRAKQGMPPVEPLYVAADADKAIRQFVSLNYQRTMPLGAGVKLTFLDAGHILGSAQVVLDIEERGRDLRYLFSGDIGRGSDEILKDPEGVDGVDVLQIESTYGDRLHAAKPGSISQLESVILPVLNAGGKVVIPAFSVGRTQQIVYALHQLLCAQRIPKIPIFVDSPLSVNATEVYRLHPECFNQEIYRFLREKENPFGMENLTYIRELAHSMRLNELKEAAIIISASGMCEAGRIRHHLRNHIADPSNLILFIGYCADHTLGAQILSGRPSVNIFGEPHTVRAQVKAIDSFSGHADRDELLNYLRGVGGPVKRIFVVHGEEAQSMGFSEALRRERPNATVTVPNFGESFEL